jgi:hypothetical protein
LVPGKPWIYLPLASLSCCCQSQSPTGEKLHTKTALILAMFRAVKKDSEAAVLAGLGETCATKAMIRRCLNPEADQRRIEFVTRLRRDARLYHPPAEARENCAGGHPRRWGRRMPAPRHHAKWGSGWQLGRAFVLGQMRGFRYKQVLCQWAVSGPGHLMHAYVIEVCGFSEPWYSVTSAVDLSPAQVVTAVVDWRQPFLPFSDNWRPLP